MPSPPPQEPGPPSRRLRRSRSRHRLACWTLLPLLFIFCSLLFLQLRRPCSQPQLKPLPAMRLMDPLPYTSHNPSGKETILVAHGAFSSRDEFDRAASFFPKAYHILVPDLPSHSEARNVKPFTLDLTSALLANLIRTQARNGTAHLVGISLGSHVMLHLAGQHPELVDQVFVTGYAVDPPSTARAYGMWVMTRVENLIPRSLIRKLMDGLEVRRTDTSIATLALCKQLVRAMGAFAEPWPARTLIMVAGKSGVLPSNDPPESAEQVAAIGRELNAKTRVVTHAQMRHPWHMIAPALFAETVTAWIERKTLPEGFEDV